MKEYRAYYNYLLNNGKMLWRDTKLGFWGKAVIDEVYETFKNIKMQNYESFLDIGSGDGCVALVASLFTKSTGIEIDKDLLIAGVNIRDRLGLSCSFINADFRHIDLNEYDVIFINPDMPFHRGLDSLFKNYKGNLIVYGKHFLPSFMRLKKDMKFVNIYQN